PCARSTSRRRPGHHRPSRSPPWVPSGPPPCRRQDLTDLNPGAALSWPENHAQGARQDNRRDLHEAIEIRGIHHRAIRSFRAIKVKGSFVPDIRQVSDTHMTGLEFQSENWVGSCHLVHVEQMVRVLLDRPIRSVLFGEDISKLFEAADRPGWQGVEPVLSCSSQSHCKDLAH
ncbi:Protein kinase superfamily protein, partial [Prunus dulcis]